MREERGARRDERGAMRDEGGGQTTTDDRTRQTTIVILVPIWSHFVSSKFRAIDID